MLPLRSSLAFLLLGVAAHGQIAPAPSGSLPNNSHIPSIISGVTLSPTSVSFTNFNVGPINGATFSSANAYISGSGGATQWVNIHFDNTVAGLSAGNYYLSFIVSNISDHAYDSGLAIDAITSTNVTGGFSQSFETLTSFSSNVTVGGSSWGLQGTGTRGIIANNTITGLAPADLTHFAFIDNGGSTGGTTISTTNIGGSVGTVLDSPAFSLVAGTTLDIKVAYLSNDGAAFRDFALVQLFKVGDTPLNSGTTGMPAATLFTAVSPAAVPEPSAVAFLMGCGALGTTWWWRRRVIVARR